MLAAGKHSSYFCVYILTIDRHSSYVCVYILATGRHSLYFCVHVLATGRHSLYFCVYIRHFRGIPSTSMYMYAGLNFINICDLYREACHNLVKITTSY